jgi:pyrroline-5-carboxylate reductase
VTIEHTKIAFIGGGNMAQAILTGLLAAKFSPENLLVCAPSTTTREKLAKNFKVNVSDNNASAANFAEVIFLAVKPNMIATVADELSLALQSNGEDKLIISLAAGVTSEQLQGYLTGNCSIVTAMPNLPSAVRQGLTGLVAAKDCSVDGIKLADDILSAVGKTIWLDDENKMPALVATAGSSPAYFFLFLEAMIESGVQLGLTHQQAENAAVQSGLGALTMASTSDLSVVELKAQVTSPKGTTQQALDSFASSQLRAVVNDAMQAAARKAANY